LAMTNPDPEKDPVWSLHAAYTASVTPKEEVEKATANYLGQLLYAAHKAGATFVVVHVGGTKEFSATEVADRMRNFLKKFRLSEIAEKLSEKRPLKLLVENTAALYPFNQNLINLVEVALDFKGVGWCVDTAHTNAAGIAWDEVRTIVNEFPPDLAHINFPGSPFGCGRDRHGWRTASSLLGGEIEEACNMTPEDIAEWEETVRTLYRKGVPLILEGSGWTNSDIYKEIKFVREMLEPVTSSEKTAKTVG
jgi:endonuclease IV